MKADRQLKREVEDELRWDPAVDASRIRVGVADGTITLAGQVSSLAQRVWAEEAARRVAGVGAVDLALDVKIAPMQTRSDAQIGEAAAGVLAQQICLRDAAIAAEVDRGLVTLRGEADWDYQRRVAEACIRKLAGVVGIRNAITLRRREAPTDVAVRIADAFQRHADNDARRIEVIVDDSTVRLRGAVGSRRAREAAASVAWSAPGVRSVINELSVD